MTAPGRWIKRAMDVAVSLAALVVLGPLMLLVAVLVRLGSPGPAVFRQERVGRGGRPFEMLKFRTMRADADPLATSPASGEDPRLTPLGRRLRETSLDELPQLWNIFRGDMSLVGPRPLYMRHAENFTERQRRRLDVRPGLTGLAQVAGRGELHADEKIEIDVQYVERQSLWLDARIIWWTLTRALGRGVVYQKWKR
jgi:lipopolysaccharide/colanic/teichoic acid biosynthesis glycosyltransferase